MTEAVDLKAYWDQVSRFSQYPVDKRADGYALGLLAEAGEVCGVVDKWLRNKYDEAEMKRRLVDELGDCAWFCVAGLALANEGEGNDWAEFEPFQFDSDGVAYQLRSLMNEASQYALWDTLDVVAHIAEQYADTTLQAVLSANVTKLTARYGE